MTLATGSTLQNGRYLIQSVMSQAEIDVTYAARHAYLDQTVYIKTLQMQWRSHFDNGSIRDEFSHRAARFAQSANPHLVRVLDGFEEDGMPFLVFKSVPGTPLAHRQQPFSTRQILELMRQLAPAVQFLHDQHLVHGHISPDTLLLRDDALRDKSPQNTHHDFDPDVVLTGMGLCSFMPSLVEHLDEITRPYFTCQHDLQSLAVVLYGLLTPQADPLAQLQGRHTFAEVRSRYAHLPSDLAESLDRVLFEGFNPADAASVSGWFCGVETVLEKIAAWGDRSTADPDAQPQHDCQPPAVLSLATTALESPAETPPDTQLEPAYSETEPAYSGDSSTMSAPAASHSVSHASPQAQRRSWKIPVALGLTSLIAALGGGYLGLSFRLQEPSELERSPIFGREIFGSEQSFPASDQWPGESDYDGGAQSPLFESTTPNAVEYSSPSSLDRPLPDLTDSFESDPERVEPDLGESETDYDFRDDIQLDTDLEPLPSWENPVSSPSTPSNNSEGDRSPTDNPISQPELAPPPPAPSDSPLEILVAPPPHSTEPSEPSQLNQAPKPPGNTRQSQAGSSSSANLGERPGELSIPQSEGELL